MMLVLHRQLRSSILEPPSPKREELIHSNDIPAPEIPQAGCIWRQVAASSPKTGKLGTGISRRPFRPTHRPFDGLSAHLPSIL
jgi:hypothetical protein